MAIYLAVPSIKHILSTSACIWHAAFCRAWERGPICTKQWPEMKILVPAVLGFQKAQPTPQLPASVLQTWLREINRKISTDLNKNPYTGCLKPQNIYLPNEEHHLEQLLRPLY